MPLSRNTPLRRAGGPKRPRNPSADVVEAVLGRASADGVLRCEVCGDPITGERGMDWALHHRRGRDGRDDCHTPQNLLVVHGADNVTLCHGRIHRNEGGESYVNGWLIHRNGFADPLMVAVLVARESRWVYLDSEGWYEDHPECGDAA
jgi:hypothetical protein